MQPNDPVGCWDSEPESRHESGLRLILSSLVFSIAGNLNQGSRSRGASVIPNS